MTAFESVKKGLVVVLAAGGLAGPIAVIIYTSSRASADDVSTEVRARSILEQKHIDLASRVEEDRREVRRSLERLTEKQDRMLELLERRR